MADIYILRNICVYKKKKNHNDKKEITMSFSPSGEYHKVLGMPGQA